MFQSMPFSYLSWFLNYRTFTFILLFILHKEALGQNVAVADLKNLSLEELMNIEVTTVSRQPEKLTGVASAIQVITQEDIKRSTATRLTEALELAPNLQVAQSSSHAWAVTARGFNGAPLNSSSLADKLLVMIDGRSIYTPLFAGVFWDVQNVLLADIDRIEVVSGPGGTLWGANAVNGVINVVRKEAKKTQGLYVTGSVGTFLNQNLGLRYGGKVGKHIHYRVYGQYMSYDNTLTAEGKSATDAWHMTQGGFRMDYTPSEKNTLTVQGDVYGGRENGPDSSFLDGQNIIARWVHTFSKKSNFRLQTYFDRTWRDQPLSTFQEQLTTYDVDFQHTLQVRQRHKLLWGVGYRYMEDKLHNVPGSTFNPESLNFYFINAFVQDEIKIIPNHLKLIAGTKFSNNYFSGWGLQPSVRLAWSISDSSTLWTAVSRALRSASRFDANAEFPIKGKKDFDWEKLTSYEIGFRFLPSPNLTISIAAYYSNYYDLRSLDFINSGFYFQNNQKANSWGGELSFAYRVFTWWKLRGGYTYLDHVIKSTATTVVSGSDKLEAIDPNQQAFVQSVMDLPGNFAFDVTARYVDNIPASILANTNVLSPAVPEYFSLNTRIAWKYKDLEFSLAVRNLLQEKHQEFGSHKIPRNIYGKITWNL